MLGTALIKWCPLNRLFGIDTCGEPKARDMPAGTARYEYYSIAGAERLRDAFPDFDSGTILIGILGHPFKCPPAPFEGALLLHDHFLARGIREAVEMRVIGPMAAPVPVTKEVS